MHGQPKKLFKKTPKFHDIKVKWLFKDQLPFRIIFGQVSDAKNFVTESFAIIFCNPFFYFKITSGIKHLQMCRFFISSYQNKYLTYKIFNFICKLCKELSPINFWQSNSLKLSPMQQNKALN